MKFFRLLVLASLFSMSSMPAMAGMVGTAEMNRAAQPGAALDYTLERQQVERQLVEHGVDPLEAARRVDQLTDAEIASLEARIDQMPAGGVSTTNLLLIIIILILLL